MKYDHAFSQKVCSNRCAPMGRPNLKPTDKEFYRSVKFRCNQVPLFDGAYDSGGAYWGCGETLYCTEAFEHIDGTTNNFFAQFFCRAKNRGDAKRQATEFYSDCDIVFYK